MRRSSRRTKLLVVLTAIFTAFLSSCDSGVRTSSFESVCNTPAGSDAVVEGYLKLPGAGISQGDGDAASQEMILTEAPDARGGFLRVLLDVGKIAGPNRMEALPATYTYADLHIFDDKGLPVNTEERVRVSGETIKGPDGCAMRISRISAPWKR